MFLQKEKHSFLKNKPFFSKYFQINTLDYIQIMIDIIKYNNLIKNLDQ
jgi:hypothetical protein